jgi:lysozyme
MKNLILTLTIAITTISHANAYELVSNVSVEGLEELKKYEAFSAKPYYDHKAYSIGYGTQKLCNGKKVTATTKAMTKEEATKHLKCMIEVKNDLLINYYIDNQLEVSQEMHDSLFSFTYNLGSYGALRSTVVKALVEKNCYVASVQMKKYNRASGKVLKGLTNRRNAEASQLLDGCKKVNESLGYTHYVVEAPKKKKVKKGNSQ